MNIRGLDLVEVPSLPETLDKLLPAGVLKPSARSHCASPAFVATLQFGDSPSTCKARPLARG